MNSPPPAPHGAVPEHEARQRGVEDARRGHFDQALAGDPGSGPAYRAGWATGRRLDALYGQVRRWFDGPAGTPSADLPPPDTDPVEGYKLGRDGALHAYGCDYRATGCGGCWPMDDAEARRLGYHHGAYRRVENILAEHPQWGPSYLEGLREGRADALARAGWPQLREVLDSERRERAARQVPTGGDGDG